MFGCCHLRRRMDVGPFHVTRKSSVNVDMNPLVSVDVIRDQVWKGAALRNCDT